MLAYGYELDEGLLCLHLYDPNRPGDDGVRLWVDLASSARPLEPRMSPSSRRVLSFFRVGYRPTQPP